MGTQAAADGGDAARAVPPRLLLEEFSSYSPNSNPFGDRPTARTPQGMQVLAAAGRKSEADADWLLHGATGEPASGNVVRACSGCRACMPKLAVSGCTTCT